MCKSILDGRFVYMQGPEDKRLVLRERIWRNWVWLGCGVQGMGRDEAAGAGKPRS